MKKGVMFLISNVSAVSEGIQVELNEEGVTSLNVSSVTVLIC
jgi:hypothetical protein